MTNRRDFVKGAVIGAAAVAAIDVAGRLVLSPEPPSSGGVPFLPDPVLPARARLLGSVPPPPAAAPTEAELIKRLYSKIQDSFGATSPTPGHSFLVLCNPGIFISPNLDLTRRADRVRLSDVLNMVPHSSFTFIFQDSGVRVPSVYGQIISNHITAKYQLTDGQKQQLKDAKKILNDQSTMDEYFRYQNLFAAASDKLANARAIEQNGGPQTDSQLIVAFNKAKSDFKLKGHRYEVEIAQEIYDQLLGGDPAEWWGALRQKYDADPDKLVDVYPTYADWKANGGWDKRTMSGQEWMTQFENSSTDVGGGFSAGWGLWRVGASANYHKDEGFQHSQAQSVDLKFEVMRANIIRPWLEPLVFRSRNWTWNQAQTDISSGGNAAGGATPKGLMPFFPTGVLLARNVELTAAFSESDRQWMNKVVDGGASVGWGPFSFGGHYHHEEHSGRSSGAVVGSTIKTAPGDVQVLGFFCDVLPKCPDKNPDLVWS